MSRSCSPSESMSPSGDASGVVLWARQLEASPETTGQHPCEPVLTTAASTGWSQNEPWWHTRLQATKPSTSWCRVARGRALPSTPYAWSVTWLVAALLPSPFQARKLKKVLTP